MTDAPSTAGTARDAAPRVQTVLLIDDNPDNREIYALYLTHLGFAVLTTGDAESGLALAAERLPDVVVMDVGLPGMDGYSATRRLKADAATRHMPVIVFTAHAMTGERERALAAGCDAYLAKPIGPAVLAGELRRVLGAS
jgi:CheY-like chemotaxis protein